MRPIDADTITQAVIARHAAAGDARLRELMTSLVQHLHAFARDVKLTEAECTQGVHFLAECGRTSAQDRPEVALLSDLLGLSTLVTAQHQRQPKGCTEAVVAAVPAHRSADAAAPRQACYVRGQVRALDGAPLAGAEVCVGPHERDGRQERLLTGSDGSFLARTLVAAPGPLVSDGPVVRLLHALGRHAWRPAHLNFMIRAAGYQRLVTQVFSRQDPYLDSDAAFGVRDALVADWVRHSPGRTPDGSFSDAPFTTLDFTFVLDSKTGDTP